MKEGGMCVYCSQAKLPRFVSMIMKSGWRRMQIVALLEHSWGTAHGNALPPSFIYNGWWCRLKELWSFSISLIYGRKILKKNTFTII